MMYLECYYPTAPHAIAVPDIQVSMITVSLLANGADCQWQFVEHTNLPIMGFAETPSDLYSPKPSLQRIATLPEAKARIAHSRSMLTDGLKLTGKWEAHPVDCAPCQRFTSDVTRCIAFYTELQPTQNVTFGTVKPI